MSFDLNTYVYQTPLSSPGCPPTNMVSGAGQVQPPTAGIRRQLADSVCDQLVNESGPPGVIIVGEAGSGKTTVLRSVIDRLRSSTCIIHLRGSNHDTQLRYGALRVLLADLPVNILEHPVRVITGLTQLLEERALGLPKIIVVDDSELLDEGSATVLGQLAQTGSIRLLAACDNLSKAPVCFQDLCRKQTLAQVNLASMTQQDVAADMKSALGGVVCRAASLFLHRQSGGNPRLLNALVDDYLSSGALRCVSGVWVLTAAEVDLGPASARIVMDQIAALEPSQQQLLDGLAAAEATPLAAVAADQLGDLDALHELKMVSIERDHRAVVSVTGPLLRDALLGRASRVDLRWAEQTIGWDPLSARTENDLASAGHLNRAYRAAYDGDYRRTIDELTSPTFDPYAIDRGERLQVSILMCEALAFTGREDEARETAKAFAPSRLSDGRPQLARIAVTLATLEAVSGDMTAMLEVAGRHLGGAGRSTGTYEEIVEGLVHAVGGRPVEAESFLTPALSQLQISDPGGVTPLVAAALAWITSEDSPERAERYLLAASNPSNKVPWIVRRLTKHFAALALQGIVSADRAALALKALIEEDGERGNSFWQLLTLSHVLRLGDQSVARSVMKLGVTCQGRYASLCALYAKGVETEDPDLVLEAMGIARTNGDLPFARDAAAAATQLADQSECAGLRAHVADRVRGIIGSTSTALGARRQLASLTTRELEVVKAMVEGTTNRDLATTLGVSVRTVEGHLYRVYTKLHVRTKSELLAKVALGEVTTQ
ncbi:LuxR family transcriptional regulator [Arthrobacter sp. Bz4]|uniref:helix-turn-helix transcriptional regulator n=1 Tax=Arthrobacter sp. Bz4 TaxID=2171979 RepID=UPI000D51A3C8|nr:LuxR family transcriptional regulator [Arthrobacter sp. Bz4]PVE16473.1 hypothetical protein DDA93_12525 [Arthrobacter sp. Bz4]